MKEVFRTEESNAVAVFKFEFNVEEKDKIYRHPCAVTEAIPKLRLACSRRYDGCAVNFRVSFDRLPDGNKTRQGHAFGFRNVSAHYSLRERKLRRRLDFPHRNGITDLARTHLAAGEVASTGEA